MTSEWPRLSATLPDSGLDLGRISASVAAGPALASAAAHPSVAAQPADGVEHVAGDRVPAAAGPAGLAEATSAGAVAAPALQGGCVPAMVILSMSS